MNSICIINSNLEKRIEILNSHTDGIMLGLNSGLTRRTMGLGEASAEGGAQGCLAECCGSERGSGLPVFQPVCI